MLAFLHMTRIGLTVLMIGCFLHNPHLYAESLNQTFTQTIKCPTDLTFYMGLKLKTGVVLVDKTELTKRVVYMIDGELTLKSQSSKRCTYALNYEIGTDASRGPLSQGRSVLSILAEDGDWTTVSTDISGLDIKTDIHAIDDEAVAFVGSASIGKENVGSVKIELAPF